MNPEINVAVEQIALMKRKLVYTSINISTLGNISSTSAVQRISRPTGAFIFALFALVLGLSGCGVNVSSKPQVGAIAFTDANGNAVAPVTMLAAGSGIYLDVAVSNDPQLLGANWSVTCSSQLPPGTPLPPGQVVDESCGFFTPVHTASAPVPSYAASGAGIVTYYQGPAAQPKDGTVTLYASPTGDPSKASSLTLSILP
jgi:hypothetical protein